MYAIVRAGGRQEKVAVGDVLVVNRLPGQPGDSVDFPPVLVVDGDKVTTERSALDRIAVTGEIIEDLRGPKIRIFTYKAKTGNRKRQGHRQELTRVKITKIGE